MNKKGQGLPLETIIVAILVIIVLVLVVTFFLGGFAGLTNRVKDIFFGTTAGSSTTLAVQNCRTYCEQAQLLPSVTLKENSPYCSTEIKVDTDNDGEADKIYTCKGLEVTCDKVSDLPNCKNIKAEDIPKS